MSKVYIFLADGFEEIEGLTVVDILRRAGIEIQMVSITGNKMIHGSHGINIEADLLFEEIDAESCDMFVLPGGMPGTRYLGEHEGLGNLLQDAQKKNKYIAAICAAPSVLGQLGLLKGHKATSYPGFEEKLEGAQTTLNPVEVSGNITTSRGMGTAIPFALSLTAQLTDQKKADDLAKAIIYQ